MLKKEEKDIVEMILMVIRNHVWEESDPALNAKLVEVVWNIWETSEAKKTTKVSSFLGFLPLRYSLVCREKQMRRIGDNWSGKHFLGDWFGTKFAGSYNLYIRDFLMVTTT